MDDDTSSGLLVVGAIVWVRRRNGSWWPGKILSPEQLPSSHLTSPRSGTPVKLLGREDASVDWYNLEKSKRVRPFRCGEFDDCIERAVASLGMPPKKREKYARREDAILHALELEKQMLGDALDNAHVCRPDSGDEESFLRGDSLHQGAPRMRALQDFGLTIVPSKRRDSPLFKPKMRHNVYHGAHVIPDGDGGNGNAGYPDDFVDSGLPSRSKRSRCGYSQHGNSGSLDGRSWEVTTPGNHRARNLMAVDPPRISDDTDAGTTESDFLVSDSNSAETEHHDDDDETSSVSDHLGGRKVKEVFESMSSEDADDSIFSEDFGRQFHRDPGAANGSVSKWQLKGKRNTRNLPKQHVEDIERLRANGRRFTSRRRVPIWRSDDYRDYDFSYSIDNTDDDEDDDDDNDEEDDGAGDDSQNTENDVCDLDDDYALTPRTQSREKNLHGGWDHHAAWEGDYYDPVLSTQPHLVDKNSSMLVEVDLKVMARYQIDPQKRLPIISMTSKLNGNSIIGHSIQIESVEDGSSNHLVSASYEANEAIDSYALPSAWRTARRTANVRLQRPMPSSIYGDEEGEDFPFSVHHETSPKRGGGGGSGRRGLLVRKGASQNHIPQAGKSLSGKTLKKVGSSSSQKIRTLSSIALEQKQVSRSFQDGLDYQTDGIIKPSSSGPTTVACIPVKLVYSRLLEKINRPPSKAVLNVVRLNSETTQVKPIKGSSRSRRSCLLPRDGVLWSCDPNATDYNMISTDYNMIYPWGNSVVSHVHPTHRRVDCPLDTVFVCGLAQPSGCRSCYILVKLNKKFYEHSRMDIIAVMHAIRAT